MIDGKPNWRRGSIIPNEPTLALVMAGRNGWVRYYLANSRWYTPWFKQARKVWWASTGEIDDAICWVPVSELLKLPCDYGRLIASGATARVVPTDADRQP